MTNNVIDEIVRFQVERNLHNQEYSSLNEHTNIFEELLESIGYDVPKQNRELLSDELMMFTMKLQESGIAIDVKTTSDEDKIDAYCDIIVFAIGAILKLGYLPSESLEETAKEINSRVGSMINGKFEKDLSAVCYKADYSKCKRK